jgi:hypothetical protein
LWCGRLARTFVAAGLKAKPERGWQLIIANLPKPARFGAVAAGLADYPHELAPLSLDLLIEDPRFFLDAVEEGETPCSQPAVLDVVDFDLDEGAAAFEARETWRCRR